MAWKDQVKIIVKDTITYVSPASQSRKSNTTHKDTDDHPWQKFSAEIGRFEQAIDFLSLSIEECHIELREETNSVVGLEEDEVKDFLKAKKYLLVLDKISNKETWDTLIEAFRDSKNGSRILLTTRDKSVASHPGSPFDPYQIQLRNKNQSWVLFTQMVRFQPEPSQPDQLSSELKNLAEKVVKRCGGLPLCILSHGYLLSGKEVSTKELSRVLEHVVHTKHHGRITWKQMEKTYYEISDRRLAALWVAEGMVKRSSDQEEESLKSVAEKYLAELIRRNLVQIVDGTLNQKFERCFFPATLRQLWLREHPSSGLDQRVLYYSFESSSHGHDDGDGDGIKSPNIMQNCSNPRSMLCFDSREGDTPGEDIGIFLQKHIASGHPLQLKVLDLEHVFRPQLPKNIGKLIHLTYLGLRWTFLESIPPSIGKLVNLETLDVKHSYIRTLPSSIWKLEKLQHLYMSDICRSKIEHQPKAKLIYHEPNTNFLQNLELLRGAFIDKDSPFKDALKKMKKLQILDLAFQLEVSEQNDLSESLEELQHLQELTSKSIDEMGRPQDLHVKHLSCLVNLSTLYLFGKLMNPSIIINLSGIPQSLTDLTLSASGLSDDPMPKLEKLHNLRSLCFYHGSYTGKKMVCSNGGFPELHVLKFWMLQELEEWNVQEHAMPSLKRLEIRSCKKLKVPTNHELRHLKSLRELKLKDMPVEFKKSIEKNKELIWGDIAFFPVNIT
ncbi:probable disease resistance protein At1g58602 [Fagus crenata]